jgi:hypothetical protein
MIVNFAQVTGYSVIYVTHSQFEPIAVPSVSARQSFSFNVLRDSDINHKGAQLSIVHYLLGKGLKKSPLSLSHCDHFINLVL